MQAISKIEQPNSPPSFTHLSSPPNTTTSSKELMHTLTKLLQQGQESTQLIRSFINKRLGLKVEDHQVDLDLNHHSLVALNSFKDSLLIAKSFELDHEDMIIKRKFDHTNNIQGLDHCKAEDSVKGIVSKERRGCYKRRRTGETRIMEVTELVDDGHAWRKYGQKEILNTNFPRNYYRCTHKHDQNCQATKQVQQISENPIKHKIIYHGNHTCKNLNKNSEIIIDPHENSSLILNFESNNYTTMTNLFPSSLAFLNTTTMVKQEELPISPSAPHDLDHVTHRNHHIYSSSSSDNLPSSSSTDVTSSTTCSQQGDSNEYRNGSCYLYDEDVFLNLTDIGNGQLHLDDII